MAKLRQGLSIALMGAIVLFGAGCSKAEVPPQTPPVVENDHMTPPDQMQGDEMMHDDDGDMNDMGMNASGTMPMGDATGTKMGMKQSPPPEMTTDQEAELKAGEAEHKPGELTFHIKGGSFFYVPNQIKVKKGDKVKIVFENVGGMHNINIDEYNVKSDTVQTDGETTVEFTADKAGSFEYYCAVGQHRAMGQKGMLVVE
ncbi:MAG: plastocyanin/azurin family copper-binding protein [Patescibacteria group bacterium]